MSAGSVSSESSERESVLGLSQFLMATSNPWLPWLVAASLPSLSPSSFGVLCVFNFPSSHKDTGHWSQGPTLVQYALI